MSVLPHRRDPIGRIDVRIERLGERAEDLFEREQQLERTLAELGGEAKHTAGGLRRRRRDRALARAQERLEAVRSERTELVEAEIRSIMRSLQEQSQRTRLALDRELGRLEPVQAQWEQMRRTFGSLEDVVATPAVQQLAQDWCVDLGIPEFPVREREGYQKPFPRGALVF
jgi:chromosome segregation ATPase